MNLPSPKIFYYTIDITEFFVQENNVILEVVVNDEEFEGLEISFGFLTN